jgi:hypothetical protein
VAKLEESVMAGPYASPIKAMMELYRTLDPLNYPDDVQPPIYIDKAVQEEGATEIRLPYTTIRDNGLWPTWSSAASFYSGKQTVFMSFWYTDLEDAYLAWQATMWNGADPQQKLGMALAQLDLAYPLVSAPVTIWPARMTQRLAGKYRDNQLVYTVTQDFNLQFYQQPTFPV